MVAWLPLPPPESGDSSRYLLTLSPKPRPLLQRLRDRLGAQPVAGLQIQWPAEWPSRIRRVISRSGTRRRYIVPCYRYGDIEAHGEAKEEEMAFVLLDACDGVEFQEQPCRLSFEFHGEPHEHIPDILVAAADHHEFWECKRTHEAMQFWIRKRAERLRALLAPLNIGYRVVSTSNLLTGAYLDNARLLRRFAKHPVSETTTLEAALRLRAANQLTVGQLARYLNSTAPLEDIFALIYSGNAHADLAKKLNINSLLYPSPDRPLPWVRQLFEPASA